MTFVHDTSALRGVDIHPHLPEPGDDQPFLDYVLPRLRADQKFLATEFSLVRFWKKYLRDPVPAEFADRYDLRGANPMWKVLRNAIDRPFPQQKWDDLLSLTPWFADNSDYLRDQVQRFRQTGKLAMAPTGIRQGAMVQDFGPDIDAWLFNSLFCPHTVQPSDDGLPGRNSAWIEDFRALQR